MHKVIDEFEHEEAFAKYYIKLTSESAGEGGKVIMLDQFEELQDRSLYLFLDAKEINTVLDLKREVVMTMLNSLEKMPVGKKFFYFQGALPAFVGLRFHKSKPEELAEKDPFIKGYLECAKEHQGVYRCDLASLAYNLNISPFQIPKILFNMQSQVDQEITYETDQEAFVLKIIHIPSQGQTLDLSQEMLAETRRIERNTI